MSIKILIEPLINFDNIVDQIFCDEQSKVKPIKVAIVAAAFFADLALMGGALVLGSTVIFFASASLLLPSIAVGISVLAIAILLVSKRTSNYPKIAEMLCSKLNNEEKTEVIQNLNNYQRQKISDDLIGKIDRNVKKLVYNAFDINGFGSTELEIIKTIAALLFLVEERLNALCLIQTQEKELSSILKEAHEVTSKMIQNVQEILQDKLNLMGNNYFELETEINYLSSLWDKYVPMQSKKI
jgi:hypothetical protein